MARAVAVGMPFTAKHGLEIANWIRGDYTGKAKAKLQGVLALKLPVPFKRFTEKAGHKRGIAAGKFPVKAAKFFLELINAVEANAQFKNLDANHLVIVHLSVNRASEPWHSGRQRRRMMKRTHIEISVAEHIPDKQDKKKADKPAQDKKPAQKQEVKKDDKHDNKKIKAGDAV
jgi:large subunit ribosomal protein L22